MINPDASGHQRYAYSAEAEDDDAPALTRDGRYVVLCSVRTGGSGNQIWRLDRASGERKQLTFGKLDVDPDVSPDGRWVVYTSWNEGGLGSVWKAPLEGGTAVQLTAGHTTNPSPRISPDGKLLAYCHSLGDERGRRVELVPFDDEIALGRAPIKDFPLPATSDLLQWLPDSQALVYAETEGRTDNLWRLPLAGGPHTRLTNFTSDRILYFAWSRDGSQLAFSRLTSNRDLIYLAGFR